MPGATLHYVRHFPRERWSGGREGGTFYHFVARLAAGASVEQAETQLRAALARLAEAYPDENAPLRDAEPMVYPGFGAYATVRDGVRETLRLLVGAGALLLLIACANVANLALFRSVQRRGEMAVRRALGAGGTRIARMYLTESALLAILGGGLGVLVAVWLAELFEGTSVLGLGVMPGFALDWRVLALTTAASIASGMLFGIAPAVTLGRMDLPLALKDAARTETRRKPWLRGALSVVQLALCLTLLVPGFLFLQTLRNLYRIDLGFDASGVTLLNLDLGDHGYTDPQALAYFDELLGRVRELPGVSAATVSVLAPLGGIRYVAQVRRPGDGGQADRDLPMNGVSSDYFKTLRIELVRGRVFTLDETMRRTPDGPSPVILSETLARELFGGRDPLGRIVNVSMRQRGDHVVVGVVRDVRWLSPVEDPGPMIYVPLARTPWPTWGVLVIRSARSSGALVPAVREVATRIASSVPLSVEETLTQRLRDNVAQQRLFAKLLNLLSALGLVLSAAGVFGLVSQTVVERTREFGIRMAMGADARSVLTLVIRRASTLAALGVAGGIAGAAVATRVIRNRLYGVEPLDPTVYVSALVVLASVALLASYLPARRAARVDPMEALRYE